MSVTGALWGVPFSPRSSERSVTPGQGCESWTTLILDWISVDALVSLAVTRLPKTTRLSVDLAVDRPSFRRIGKAALDPQQKPLQQPAELLQTLGFERRSTGPIRRCLEGSSACTHSSRTRKL